MTKRLSVWLIASQSSWQAAFNQVLGQYCRAPGVEIELTCASWNRTWSLIVESLKNNALPDVMQIGSSWLSGLMALTVLSAIDVEDAYQRFNPVEDFSPVLWNRVVQKGRVWAVPWLQDFRLLYYRRDLVEDLPGFSAGLENWEQLLSLFTSQTPYIFPGLPESILVQTAASWIWAMGWDFPPGRTPLHEDWAGFLGIDALYREILKGSVVKEASVMGAGEVNRWFFELGRGAWYLSRPISLDEMDFRHSGSRREAASRLGVAAIPANCRSPQTTFVGGSFLVVPKTSKHPELAWDLVEKLSQADAQSSVAHRILSWPARSSAALAEFTPAIDARVVQQAMARGRTEPMLAHWPVYEAIFARRLANLFAMAWEGRPIDQANGEKSQLVQDFNDVVWVSNL